MHFIDFVTRYPKEKSVLIKGWAFSDTSQKPVFPEITTDEPILEIIEKQEERTDVLNSYDLNPEESTEYGFAIKLYLEKLKGKIKLVFPNSDENGEDEEIILDLNKSLSHPNERNQKKEAVRNILQRGKSFLTTGNGVRYLIRKFKKKIQSVDPVYQNWILNHEQDLSPEEVDTILNSLEYKPLISILVPVYNVDLVWLDKMVNSVLNQTYPNWQLCIADDCSTNPQIRDYLRHLKKENDKVKVVFRKENGRISKATNSAFELATGEYIGLLDNDDELAPNALLENVIFINEHPGVDVIYSDEDKIDENGVRKDPYFKTDFAPDTIMSNNYICHFLLFKRSLIKDGEELLRSEYDGAQDYDLILRLIDRVDHVGHIPKILYHWRSIPTSTAQSAGAKDYIIEAGKHALEDALKRRGLKGQVFPLQYGGFYEVVYEADKNDKVSVIIPTKNNGEDIRNCVFSIIEKTEHPNYEIVIVDNGSTDKKTLETIDYLKEKFSKIVRVLRLPVPFNYSLINNRAAEFATGDYYLFLNDDTEVITQGWMKKMLGYASQDWIGCVGAKLLYPDNTIQHAGVIMGILGIAGHVFVRYPKEVPGYFGRFFMNSNYTAVTAACLMVGKEKFWQVGGFDEEIAVAFNDVDLCCKLANEGYYNIYLGGVELYHYESKSRGYETTPDKMLRFEKEKGRIIRKWREFIDHDPMYNPNLSLSVSDYSIDTLPSRYF